jgi:hypothetical protein
VDEPDNWKEYLKSKWHGEWETALVDEVTKLEDLSTWIKVPRSAARGKLVHKVKIVFKVKQMVKNGTINARRDWSLLARVFDSTSTTWSISPWALALVRSK